MAPTVRKKAIYSPEDVLELTDFSDTTPPNTHPSSPLLSVPDIADSSTSTDKCTEQANGTDGRDWPTDYYCREIDEGLRLIRLQPKGTPLSAGFWLAFPDANKFVKSTFYDNRKRWLEAASEQRKIALEANMTDDGKWSVFTLKNPAEDREVRNAKKRLKRANNSKSKQLEEPLETVWEFNLPPLTPSPELEQTFRLR